MNLHRPRVGDIQHRVLASIFDFFSENPTTLKVGLTNIFALLCYRIWSVTSGKREIPLVRESCTTEDNVLSKETKISTLAGIRTKYIAKVTLGKLCLHS